MAAFRVLFAGGGTGGHLFPAIAIAEELKKLRPETEIHFVGTKKKLEAHVVPQKGYAFHTIWISGFHRSLRLDNLLFPLKVIVSFMQALSIIKKYNPDVVVGTGGYVSGPVLRAAIFSGIPTLIQEQNSYPGVTTRMLAGKVTEVHLTFEQSKKFLVQRANVFVTGNPTRSNLENVDQVAAVEYFGFDQHQQKTTILVVGGSLGAHSINMAMIQCLDQLVQRGLRIIWQTGNEDSQTITNSIQQYTSKDIWVNSFIDRMDYAYAVADIVVCRAGATTIAELTRLGKPAILVPYPFAAANHQVENARSLAESGAAIVLKDNEVAITLQPAIKSLLDLQKRRNLGDQSKRFGKPNAAADIAKKVLQLSRVK